jgi:hypothetical protein
MGNPDKEKGIEFGRERNYFVAGWIVSKKHN